MGLTKNCGPPLRWHTISDLINLQLNSRYTGSDVFESEIQSADYPNQLGVLNDTLLSIHHYYY